MNDAFTSVEKLLEQIQTYIQTSFDLIKLRAVSKSADSASSMGAVFVISITAVIFLLMISLGMAFWIGQLTGSLHEGFFIVSAFYAILTLCLFFFRKKWLKSPIQNSIISNILQT